MSIIFTIEYLDDLERGLEAANKNHLSDSMKFWSHWTGIDYISSNDDIDHSRLESGGREKNDIYHHEEILNHQKTLKIVNGTWKWQVGD